MTGAPSWPPYYFDIGDGDGPGATPAVELPLLIDNFARDMSRRPEWHVDKPGGSRVRLSLVSHERGLATIAFESKKLCGSVSLAADPSGWLRVEAEAGGQIMFTAFVDQPYEEFALWPANAVPTDDELGRMGKRRNWMSLRANAWPALAPLANEGGWINIREMDLMTVHVRLLREGVEVWRPVEAIPDLDGFLLVAREAHDPETEQWEFPPNAIVRCEMRKLGDEEVLVAIARV